MRTVLTIHNIAYQGRFPAGTWPLPDLDGGFFTPDFLEFFGDVSYLKAGLVFADAVTTVSPRYAYEIQTPELGVGLDGVLRSRADALRGILNGIDDERVESRDRSLIAARTTSRTATGRRCARRRSRRSSASSAGRSRRSSRWCRASSSRRASTSSPT